MVEQYIRINQGEYGRTLLSGEVFPFLGHGRTPKGQRYVFIYYTTFYLKVGSGHV